MSVKQAPTHLFELAHEEWAVWRWIGLRGAGFPAKQVLALADPACGHRADAVLAAEALAAEVQSQALAAVNAALDELSASQGGDDRRKALVVALRALKKGNLPLVSPSVPLAVAEALAALETARADVTTARAQFAQAFQGTTEATSQALTDLSNDDRFREALVWQNRRALHTGIAALRRPVSVDGRGSQRRQHEELAASYLQRYCVKNDTIGFFGPVGWATFGPSDAAITVQPGPALLAARTVFFEQWGIDALAAMLAKTKVLRPWCAPRPLPFFDLRGTTLHWPGKRPLQVSPAQAALLERCTGTETAVAIAATLCQTHPQVFRSAAEVYKLLDQLSTLGVITWTLEIPFVSHPDLALRAALGQIGEERLRRLAFEGLDELDRLRSRVAEAAGNAAQLDQALGELEASFTRLTGADSTRNAGATYAARTLIYEDCRRDIAVEIGAPLREALGPPLALLLASARWFTYQTAALYRVALDELYAELARKTGSPDVEMVAFWQEAQARLHNDQPRLALTVLRMFQERWADVLALPANQHQVSYTSAALEPRVAAAFAAPGPGWHAARYHSPDVMIAAASPEAIRRGAYQLVMGELHLAGNTLRGALFVNQHPAPHELLAAVEHDIPTPQVVPVAPRKWPEITARTRAEFVTKRDALLAFTYDVCGQPAEQLLPIGALVVSKQGTKLVVRTRDGQRQFDIVEFFSEILLIDVIDNFKIFSPQPHTPRVTIDRLVVSRETWRFVPAALAFASEKYEASRFLEARRWAAQQGLPHHVFVKMPTERKPFFVDFDSPILVNMFAKAVRRMLAQDAGDALFSVTEMYPSIDQTWLADAQGNQYTSELRIVAVDQHGPPPP